MAKKKFTTSVHVERAKLRITQEELANAVGTTRQTIHAIETGKSEPYTSLAMRIARYFKVKIDEIFQLNE